MTRGTVLDDLGKINKEVFLTSYYLFQYIP